MSNETHSTLIHINSKSIEEYSVWMQRLVEFLDGKIILYLVICKMKYFLILLF